MSRVYATSADYQTYTGQVPTADTDRLLAKASRFLDAQVFKACWYLADDAGLPADPVVAAAFAAAVCAQVEWRADVGDTTGAAGVGYGSVQIGSVSLGRSVTAVRGEDSPARQVAPEVWDALTGPDMTRDRFVLGAVCT
ncbi:hypothetical protein ACFC58_36240 [Kitasatospora purpeofusca]|uniref:hypothetical protein n=1 Tax=Kitasatospora purpeofusca TaxID=67352 RepID=UPI0035E2A72F